MSKGCCPTIMELLGFGEGKYLFTRLELGWKGLLLVLNWNKGIFPRDWVFAFLKDCGSVRMWKLLTGKVGIDHDKFYFFSSECEKGEIRSKRLEVYKEGEDYDLWIFLACFKICSGSGIPGCKGEVVFLLVPILLVATVDIV